ncbi:MAG: NHL repeat-containing protein [Treponema sp.]|nr:NHL repeat-containing protein [Treponema sp.]
MNTPKAGLLFIVGFLLLAGLSLGAQQSPGPGISIPLGYEGADLDTLRAREEFRIGVQAYNRYSYNEAILSMERALAFRPGEPLILDWLGRAYYRSGIENAAFRAWQAASAAYGLGTGPGILVASRMETLRNRRSLLPVPDDEVRYVESGGFPSRDGEIIFYGQPSAILTQDDGSAWVVAFGSNEIVRIDPNGIIRERRRGPLVGFDRPYDLVRGIDGRLFLSEFRGNRISVLSPAGDWLYHIGSRGQGPGQLMGPQNLTVDQEGYLYVVDYGNRRISKFDPNGTFILSFGQRAPGFQGFVSPTGIIARGERIYIADNILRAIYIFDQNGNYLGPLVTEGLESPESLRLLSDGRILGVDSNRILLIDPDSAIIRELGLLGNPSRVRITGAEMDSNGNVLAADFQSGEVSVMTRIDDMAAGLFVEITRVVSDNFPLVTVELEVSDRLRRPVMGLDARNFLLSEGGIPVREQNFLSAGYRAESADLAILIERSPATAALGEDLAAAVRDIDSAAGRVLSIISAAEQPIREDPASAQGATPAARLASAARGSAASYSPRWSFDLALRLAATDLLGGSKKRAVVFVGAGAPPGSPFSLGDLAFEHYSIAELSAYLTNNNVAFYAIIVGGGLPGREVSYLAEETGGQVISLYRSEGIIPVIQAIGQRSSGSYTLSYRSSLPTDFGRNYLPLEAEVYLMERSGRDSTGYFPPLE